MKIIKKSVIYIVEYCGDKRKIIVFQKNKKYNLKNIDINIIEIRENIDYYINIYNNSKMVK